MHATGVPAVHTPLWHVSSPLQALPSEHDAPFGTGGNTQIPVCGSHVAPTDVRHTGGAPHEVGVPAVHAPARHVSNPLQALPSEHDVPFGSTG